jgi:hypothetical protein
MFSDTNFSYMIKKEPVEHMHEHMYLSECLSVL